MGSFRRRASATVGVRLPLRRLSERLSISGSKWSAAAASSRQSSAKASATTVPNHLALRLCFPSSSNDADTTETPSLPDLPAPLRLWGSGRSDSPVSVNESR
jgi:hypothetical protein